MAWRHPVGQRAAGNGQGDQKEQRNDRRRANGGDQGCVTKEAKERRRTNLAATLAASTDSVCCSTALSVAMSIGMLGTSMVAGEACSCVMIWIEAW